MLISRNLLVDDSGQDLVEYALIILLVSLVALAALTLPAQKLKNAFGNIAAAFH